MRGRRAGVGMLDGCPGGEAQLGIDPCGGGKKSVLFFFFPGKILPEFLISEYELHRAESCLRTPGVSP